MMQTSQSARASLLAIKSSDQELSGVIRGALIVNIDQVTPQQVSSIPAVS